ncbi:MAG TPA: HEAT repeat domain-containing protein [Terracidiphilus sp.]|nr:HEAT repeat domain-containing protein [Terracidiphilus sp.]
MKLKAISILFVSAALMAAPGSSLAAWSSAAWPMSGASVGADEASLYADGTRAINDSRWADAVGLFDRVAQMRGEHAAGALYWKAYAENKEGRPASALSTCGELRKTYPTSRWLNECGALEIEIRGKSGHPVSPQTEPDEELKLLALNALMQQDQAQAIPILQKILSGKQSEQLKSRALFVLAQSQSPQAQTLITQIAEGQSNPALQVKAIRMLAVAKGRGASATLASIYQRSSDVQVKKEILRSYLITGDSSKLLEVSRQETNPELVKTAVQTLGAMGASADLLTMYRASNSTEAKADIINALIASGAKGVASLQQIASTEQDAELRRKAIRNLGISGGMSAAPTLVSMYEKSSDAGTKRAAAQALFLANDAHDLVTLARGEKDAEMKGFLVQQLSLMHSPEATTYMLEILNK